MDEGGWKAVKPFLAAKNVNYPVVPGNEGFFHSGLIGRGEYQTEILQLPGAKQEEARIDERDVRPLLCRAMNALSR
ncbi:MAG TPA: hypothetical protein VGL82_08545 [Bryobacteraceae bacterium]